MTFGDKIRQAREKLGLTQQEVADHFGISREAVQQWEKNKARPRGAKLAKLAEVLQEKLQSLLTDDEEMPLSADELAAVALYRKVAHDSRGMVRDLMRKLAPLEPMQASPRRQRARQTALIKAIKRKS